MTGRHRSKTQRERDRATISELYLRGWSQSRIGEYLELDQSSISRELKVIRDDWKLSALRDFDEIRGQQLAQLELIKTELWESWQQSKGAKEMTVQEQISSLSDAAEKRLKTVSRQQSAHGDAIYLSGIVSCLKEESKLLGLYPSEGTGTGQSIALTDAQLGVLAQVMGESNAASN